MLTALQRSTWALVLTFTWAGGGVAQTEQDRLTTVRKQIQNAEIFDFGKVTREHPVEHTFHFHNSGAETLEIKNVQLTPPLSVIKMSRQAQPGETGSLIVQLGQPRQAGDFEGLIVLQFKNEAAPNYFFRVQGRVVRSIDFEPMPAFYITSFKGESRQQSIEIANYEQEPLKYLKIESDSSRFTTDLTTLQPGRRYRLTVTLKQDALAGRTTDSLRVLTSNERQAVIPIPVNTQVRERVYYFPDSVSMGLIDTASLKLRPEQAKDLTQSIVVYQRNGSDFHIAAQSDLPFLRITVRQAQLKDRFEIVAEVIPERLRTGTFDAPIRISTNDPEFPGLEIPFSCSVKGNW